MSSIDIAPFLMGDPISTSRRPPTDEEIERSRRGPKTQDSWTDHEESILRDMHARDWSYEAIARALGRTRSQCSTRAQRLRLPAREPRRVGFKGSRRRVVRTA